MRERKSGTDRERQNEGAEEKHEVIGGTFTSAGSLTSLCLFLSLSLSLPVFLFLRLSLSVLPSFPLSQSLSLSVISLPVAIPTTFSGVTQQKEEGDGLDSCGGCHMSFLAHIHARTHIHTFKFFFFFTICIRTFCCSLIITLSNKEFSSGAL